MYSTERNSQCSEKGFVCSKSVILVFHYLLDGFLGGSGLDYWYFILTGSVLVSYLLRQLPKRTTV